MRHQEGFEGLWTDTASGLTSPRGYRLASPYSMKWTSRKYRGSAKGIPWGSARLSHNRWSPQAHLSEALHPLTSQLRTLQPKQVQPLTLGVDLKGVFIAEGTGTRIQAHTPRVASPTPLRPPGHPSHLRQVAEWLGYCPAHTVQSITARGLQPITGCSHGGFPAAWAQRWEALSITGVVPVSQGYPCTELAAGGKIK